eukprot:CAMPEP_0181129062 /NCGR_PEP_ID=MMETSP1071-20121207/29121_1 /TAXON_ID=35127 /ORGANISM="Thalassiosira sp., Strain NH16" /LENGTH=435 /DNA_ID=CAMNT_0023215023 /DNA_START=25 /DNA_END=1332 /DNA_ORIENTATION=-
MTRSNTLLALLALAASNGNHPLLHGAEAKKDRLRKFSVTKKQQQVKQSPPSPPSVSPTYSPTEWPTWFPTAEATPKPTNKRQAAKAPGGATSPNTTTKGTEQAIVRPPSSNPRTGRPTSAPSPEPTSEPTRIPAAPKNDIVPPPLMPAGIVIASDDNLDIPPGTEEAFVNVLENDIGSNLRVQSIDQQGAFGTCAISLTLNEVVYAPDNLNFIGSDECVYEVCDDMDDCDMASVKVQIKEVITSDPVASPVPRPTPDPTAELGTDKTLVPTEDFARITSEPTKQPITAFPTEGELVVETFVPTAEENTITTGDSYDNQETSYMKDTSYDSSTSNSSTSHDGYMKHPYSSNSSSSGSGSSSSSGSWSSSGSHSGKSGKSGGSGSGKAGKSGGKSTGSWSSSSDRSKYGGGSWGGRSSSSSSSHSGKSGKSRRNLRH